MEYWVTVLAIPVMPGDIAKQNQLSPLHCCQKDFLVSYEGATMLHTKLLVLCSLQNGTWSRLLGLVFQYQWTETSGNSTARWGNRRDWYSLQWVASFKLLPCQILLSMVIAAVTECKLEKWWYCEAWQKKCERRSACQRWMCKGQLFLPLSSVQGRWCHVHVWLPPY